MYIVQCCCVDVKCLIAEDACRTDHLSLLLTHQRSLLQSCGKFYRAAALKFQLELALADPVAIGLSSTLAPQEIGAENRLLHADLAQRDEREAERLHPLLLVLRIEDHPVRRQV